LCQSASRVKLILGLSSTSKVEDLWTTRLAQHSAKIPFSLIVVALCAMQNSSHLIATTILRLGPSPFEVYGSLLFHSRSQCVQSRDSDFNPFDTFPEGVFRCLTKQPQAS
jgi:hypothetical protein